MEDSGAPREQRKIVQFGKYKGRAMQEVLDSDPSYARWVLSALAGDATRNQADFMAYIKEHLVDYSDYSKDPLLKDAWYLDSRAKVLNQHGLDPELCSYTETPEIVCCGVEAISGEAYRSMLDQDLLRQQGNAVDPELDFVVHLSTGIYFLKPEIVNAALTLREKYRENERADKLHISAGTPSRVINRYWLSDGGICNISTGKWTLFFDRRKENADGLTDLDICYRLLREKSAHVGDKFSFKVSTRRPNSNTTDQQKGVVVVYCSEDNRVDILLKLARLLSLKHGKYYWKYHTARYAKDGVKASDFCYVLNN